jgi:hypothetical protein
LCNGNLNKVMVENKFVPFGTVLCPVICSLNHAIASWYCEMSVTCRNIPTLSRRTVLKSIFSLLASSLHPLCALLVRCSIQPFGALYGANSSTHTLWKFYDYSYAFMTVRRVGLLTAAYHMLSAQYYHCHLLTMPWPSNFSIPCPDTIV